MFWLLFIFIPSAVADLPLLHYIPLVSALGVVFAWLYNRTGGSVLLCILLHAGVNFSFGVIGTGEFTKGFTGLTLYVGLIVVLALVVYRQLRDSPYLQGSRH